MGKRKGFTLIEVALFLAVTAALFIGIALGVNNSIYQQRRNDSVQNFLEFMRSIYSKVSNPQSQGAGNSGEAIYGKLVVFGETRDLTNSPIDYSDGSVTPVFVYDVIGNATIVESDRNDIVTLLKNQKVSPFNFEYHDGNIIGASMASPEKYEPRWGAAIETENNELFEGAVMVVRHPKSGTINTLVSSSVINVNEEYYKAVEDHSRYSSVLANMLVDLLNNGSLKVEEGETNFCVNPNGLKVSSGMAPRQDIRIEGNVRNASSVKLIELDDKWSEDNKDGNRCYR